MEILNNCSKIKNDTVVVLGSFDGIHLGHRALIDLATKLGKKNNLKTMVFTFENHPLSMIRPDRMPKLLTSNRIKREYLSKLGVDILVLEKFNEEFMRRTPEEFIQFLIESCRCKHIVVGYNYRFGYKNLGDSEYLIKMEEKYGYKTHVVEKVKECEVSISSTMIRGLIFEGEVAAANKYLGHTFVLDGKVIHGKKIGRTIGFPTLNLDYDTRCAVPKGGVYFTVVEYDGKFYKGITNVGYNPTVNGEQLSIETHVLDFDKNIYGEYFKLNFIRKIREEKKFDSIDELKAQINEDKEIVKEEVMWF